MVWSCVSSVLHPFCRLSTLRCCVPPPASGRGWVLSAGLIGMWSLLFQSVRQVEDFVPHHVENAGFARGVAQDLAAESVLTGYMRCRGTRGISAILEKWPIPLSGANPPVSGVYHTTVKIAFFGILWHRPCRSDHTRRSRRLHRLSTRRTGRIVFEHGHIPCWLHPHSLIRTAAPA